MTKRFPIWMMILLLSFVVACKPDGDDDGVKDEEDNCTEVSNPDQADGDGDGRGDACDPCPEDSDDGTDDDGDGIPNACDVCPDLDDDQTDTDEDGFGDACDVCPNDRDTDQADEDGDGVGDDCDNCISVANTDQANSDGDPVGDACDVCVDMDDDQTDTDADGFGDICDNCPVMENVDQADDDSDTIGNPCDNCRMTENTDQSDLDGDGFGDVCDSCIPGGDVNYAEERFSVMTANDQIRISDVTAGDFDGDGINDIALLNFLGPDRIIFYQSVLAPQGDNPFFNNYDTAQPGTGANSIVFIDVDGDGFSELASANSVDVSVIQNRAEGNRRDLLFDSDEIYTIGGIVGEIEKGDFDNDGMDDLVLLAGAPNRVVFLFNDGNGGFLDPVPVTNLVADPTLQMLDIAVANFDGSAGDDVAVLFDANTYVVYNDIGRDGSSTGSQGSVATTEQTFQFLAAGSIEQNDVWDLSFMAPRFNNMGIDINPEIAVYKNDGGSFSEYYSEVIGVDATTLIFSDVDFNGFADIVVGPYFWKHADSGGSYENGRVRVQTPIAPIELLHVNVNDDFSAEFVAAEELRAIVLEAGCD